MNIDPIPEDQHLVRLASRKWAPCACAAERSHPAGQEQPHRASGIQKRGHQ
jgi:hypothetical protein